MEMLEIFMNYLLNSAETLTWLSPDYRLHFVLLAMGACVVVPLIALSHALHYLTTK